MKSLRSHEGYMLIDHVHSPGVPSEVMVAQGLPPDAGRAKFESATFTCSHCECVVVLNPDRSRERGYCPSCDHLICDLCEYNRTQLSVKCYPFKEMVKDILEQFDKGKTESEVFQSPLILP